jgi:predicted membrane channel-forming protein YqfA (hemolysin III family)
LAASPWPEFLLKGLPEVASDATACLLLIAAFCILKRFLIMTDSLNTPKRKALGYVVLGLICLFALLVAFVVTPAISDSTGIADETVSLALGGIFFAIAVVCALWVKWLNQQKAAEKK